MIDINELRQSLGAIQPEEVSELIDRLEAAESSVAWHQRRWMALQSCQKKMREPERTMVCDIIANGELMHPTIAGDRYTLPGAQAQPSPSIPEGWKLVPIEPTSEMLDKGSDQSDGYVSIAQDVWAAMLAAAPEAKP